MGAGARLARDIGSYLDYLEATRRASPHTLAAYRRDLALLDKVLAERGIDTRGDHVAAAQRNVLPRVADHVIERQREVAVAASHLQRDLAHRRAHAAGGEVLDGNW